MSEPHQNEELGVELSGTRSKARVVASIGVGLLIGALFFWGLSHLSASREVPDWVPPAPPPLQMAQVEVFSSPPGAKVFLEDGGVSLAETPGVISLMPGERTLRFELPGLPVKKVTLNTEEEKQAQVSWEAAVVKIRARPERVPLLLDGAPYGFTPATLYFPKGSTPHEVKACPKDAAKGACPEGAEEKVFVFQPAHDLEHLFDFTSPASAPAQ